MTLRCRPRVGHADDGDRRSRVVEQAVKPNRRKTQVTAQQVLAQILTLQPPDPAAVLLRALGVNTLEVRGRLEAGTPAAE